MFRTVYWLLFFIILFLDISLCLSRNVISCLPLVYTRIRVRCKKRENDKPDIQPDGLNSSKTTQHRDSAPDKPQSGPDGDNSLEPDCWQDDP